MIVARSEMIAAQTATKLPFHRKTGAVQQFFADWGFAGRQSGRRHLGFDSSCAITSGHLGTKLHEKAAASGQRQRQGQALE
jgi:hypothetical protein